jgi:hypothetical protein
MNIPIPSFEPYFIPYTKNGQAVKTREDTNPDFAIECTNSLYTSGGLKQERIVMESFKVGPLKTSISQPLKNASFLGLDGCEIEVFNGSGFTLLKHRIRDTRELFLRKQVFSEKNPPCIKK